MSTVGFVCATVSLLGLNKVFLYLLLYGAQDGGLLAALGYPAVSAEPVEGEMCWVRSLGSRPNPSGQRPWEPPLERSVTVHRTRGAASWCQGVRALGRSSFRPRSWVTSAICDGALSTEGAGPGWHFEGQRWARSLFPLGCWRAKARGAPVWKGLAARGAGAGLRRGAPVLRLPRCPGWWPGTPGASGRTLPRAFAQSRVESLVMLKSPEAWSTCCHLACFIHLNVIGS